MTVLVTGGAGYVGSHVVWRLRDEGRRLVVLDDLSTGLAALLPDGVPLVVGNVGDAALLDRVMQGHGVLAVMHFAASSVAPESVARPLDYYANNTLNSHALIAACLRHGVGRFVFSSTAAVYGAPERLPVDEDAPLRPITPYGRSKRMTEEMLADAEAAHGLRYAALRYFNVAGADPLGRCGECVPHPTHLVKVACQVALGRRPALEIYGDDYATPDGTGIRDYIHPSDLAEAHLLALADLEAGGAGAALNCGYGHGFSVRQVIAAVERVSGCALPVVVKPRRPGDPEALVAGTARIRARYGWRPRHDDLEGIVASALAWESRPQ